MFPNGPEGMFRGAAMVYFAFLGFDGVTSLAEETIAPEKNVPRGILGSLAVISVTFVAVTFALSGADDYHNIHIVSPLAAVFPEAWAQAIISFGALIASPTVILAEMIALSRILYCMGRDSLLPKEFAHINGWRRTPLNSILLSVGGVSFMAFVFDVPTLGSLTSIGAAIGFVAVCSCVLKRRYERQLAEARQPYLFGGVLGSFIVLTGTASLSVYHFWAVWVKVLLWCCVAASFAAICTCHALLYKTWTLRTLDSSTNPERGPLLHNSETPTADQENVTATAVKGVFSTQRDHQNSSLTPTQRLLGVTYLTPLVPAMPLLGIVCTMHMLLGLSVFAYAVYAAWATLGIIVYCAFSVESSSRRAAV
eukprot:INCI18857.1.p1 GENE.INCI18857.1~~INCI18857.1.p1  ORF type:complete len:366 (-),score=36.18 INCI18857.1:49-1146(-)